MMKSTSICPEVFSTQTSWRLSLMFRFCNLLCLLLQLFLVRLGRQKNLRISTLQYSTISLRTPQKRDRSLLKFQPLKIHSLSTYLSTSLTTSRKQTALKGITIGGTSPRRRYRTRWTGNWSKMRRSPSCSCSSGFRTNLKRVHYISRFNREKRAKRNLLRLELPSKF